MKKLGKPIGITSFVRCPKCGNYYIGDDLEYRLNDQCFLLDCEECRMKIPIDREYIQMVEKFQLEAPQFQYPVMCDFNSMTNAFRGCGCVF